MKCFYHPQTDAVGQCTHCQKGVCHDCTFEDVGGHGILCYECFKAGANVDFAKARRRITGLWVFTGAVTIIGGIAAISSDGGRSEEHTSELQSRRDLVCRLLLEKK